MWVAMQRNLAAGRLFQSCDEESNVVLPLPLGPISATNSPASTCSETSRSDLERSAVRVAVAQRDGAHVEQVARLCGCACVAIRASSPRGAISPKEKGDASANASVPECVKPCGVSLRWHYPDQVPSVGGGLRPPSQPGFPQAPVAVGQSIELCTDTCNTDRSTLSNPHPSPVLSICQGLAVIRKLADYTRRGRSGSRW